MTEQAKHTAGPVAVSVVPGGVVYRMSTGRTGGLHHYEAWETFWGHPTRKVFDAYGRFAAARAAIAKAEGR